MKHTPVRRSVLMLRLILVRFPSCYSTSFALICLSQVIAHLLVHCQTMSKVWTSKTNYMQVNDALPTMEEPTAMILC